MIRRKLVMTVILMSLMLGNIQSQVNVKLIEEMVQRYFDTGRFNGYVLVSDDEKIIFEKGYGYADKENKKPFSADTKFPICSITKQYTASVILMLADEGKLKLDDKLITYVKDYKPGISDKVTIHQMLTNTSGIPDYFGDGYFQIAVLPHYFNDILNLVENKPLDFEPGTQFKWSNTAWLLLGKVIENITGKNYADVVTEKILNPLGLKNTSFFDAGKKIREFAAQGYSAKLDEYVPAPEFFFAGEMSADGIVVTATDLAKFGNAVIKGRLHTASSSRLMFSPHTVSDTRNAQYGYGWYVGDFQMQNGEKIKFKTLPGGMEGFQSSYMNLNDKYSVVIFANHNDAAVNQLRIQILNIIVGLEPRFPKKDLGKHIINTIKLTNAADGIKEIEKLISSKNPEFAIDENELNLMAYKLLQSEFKKESLEFFKFIVKLYPDSWNAYDSLGEAYMINGDLQSAKENYEKSLKLNPDNANGKQMLEKIK